MSVDFSVIATPASLQPQSCSAATHFNCVCGFSILHYTVGKSTAQHFWLCFLFGQGRAQLDLLSCELQWQMAGSTRTYNEKHLMLGAVCRILICTLAGVWSCGGWFWVVILVLGSLQRQCPWVPLERERKMRSKAPAGTVSGEKQHGQVKSCSPRTCRGNGHPRCPWPLGLLQQGPCTGERQSAAIMCSMWIWEPASGGKYLWWMILKRNKNY